METSVISSKGQLVVPKHFRDALSLKPGMEVVIELSGSKLILFRKPSDPVKGFVEAAEKVAIRNVRRQIKEE
jgi:AbrB family looped-hinge helix DNA binding protein